MVAAPAWAVDVGVWAGVVLSVVAVLGLFARWFIVPAFKEALRTDFAPVIGEVVADQLAPFVSRLTVVETELKSLNRDLRRHMEAEDNERRSTLP